MIRYLLFLFMFASVISAISCSDQKTPEPNKVDSCLTAGQIISYSNDIVPILNTYCTDPSFGSCHQSNNDPNASGLITPHTMALLQKRRIIFNSMAGA